MTTWKISEDDAVIFTTEDPEGRSIHLTKKGWGHAKAGHPEVTLTVPRTRSIVQKPDFIIETPRFNTLAYTQTTSISLYYNIYVKMDETLREGIIKTVFLAGTLPKGEAIWIKK